MSCSVGPQGPFVAHFDYITLVHRGWKRREFHTLWVGCLHSFMHVNGASLPWRTITYICFDFWYRHAMCESDVKISVQARLFSVSSFSILKASTNYTPSQWKKWQYNLHKVMYVVWSRALTHFTTIHVFLNSGGPWIHDSNHSSFSIKLANPLRCLVSLKKTMFCFIF